jgi:GAF domain-containing protein/ANTAR domain-containing protein
LPVVGQQDIEPQNASRNGFAPGLVGLDRLCAFCVEELPGITDAALVVTGTLPAARETVGWQGPDAAALEELQYVTGEGPGLDATVTGRPVLVWDLGSEPAGGRWPLFTPEAWRVGIRALLAIPLLVGSVGIGVLALYGRRPGPSAEDTLGAVAVLGRVAAGMLLKLTESDLGAAGERSGHNLAHQASGVVAVRHGIAPAEALELIRGHAYRSRRSLRRVAADILANRCDPFPEG